MSSVYAVHPPPPLHHLGPRAELGASCLPIPPSHARRDQAGGSVDTSLPTFTGGLPTPPISKAMTGDSVAVAHSLQPAHFPSGPYHHVSASATNMQQSLSQSSHKSLYISPNSYQAPGSSVAEREKNAVASHPQNPEPTSKSKGSLADFAAEITCLFWFESSETLDLAEKTPKDGYVGRGLVADAVPTPGFRKWVMSILSTTQVSKEVILLALMFIYRLKNYNPTVSGKRGSEFRLLTIALMLGNKFLDDNTYTNKTWADVSGISVTEIHIMEVEFLSNMRYDLYASEAVWLQWKDKLSRLGAFYEKAAALPHPDAQPITPTNQSFAHKLPSPPSTHGSSAGAGASSMQLPITAYGSIANPISTAPQLPRSPLRQRQQAAGSDAPTHRKRSLDLGSESRSAKRLHLPSHATGLPAHPQSYVAQGSLALPAPLYPPANGQTGVNSDALRLPVPRLPAQMAENQLAPLNNVPVSRAMAAVYPAPSAANVYAAAPSSTTNVYPTSSSTVNVYPTPSATASMFSQPITPMSATPAAALYPSQMSGIGLFHSSHHTGVSSHASPTAAYGGTSTPTLPGLSPSHFLGDRQSPYRPVRNVNTLLIPPPSAALHNSVRHIAAEQIRYQPLGKANQEYRSGPLPHLHPDNLHQSNTPLAQKYPYRF